ALLEQERNALGQFIDDLILASHHLGEVEPWFVDQHAMFRKLGDLDEFLAGIEQCLARDAADIEASAAQGRALLDDGWLEPELARLKRAGVSAGAAADDHEVEGVGHGCD